MAIDHNEVRGRKEYQLEGVSVLAEEMVPTTRTVDHGVDVEGPLTRNRELHLELKRVAVPRIGFYQMGYECSARCKKIRYSGVLFIR